MQIFGERIRCSFAKNDKYTEIPKLNTWGSHMGQYMLFYVHSL